MSRTRGRLGEKRTSRASQRRTALHMSADFDRRGAPFPPSGPGEPTHGYGSVDVVVPARRFMTLGLP